MTKKETELKPCPFCGKKPELICGGFGYKIGCCFGTTNWNIDKNKLVDFWNTRKEGK